MSHDCGAQEPCGAPSLLRLAGQLCVRELEKVAGVNQRLTSDLQQLGHRSEADKCQLATLHAQVAVYQSEKAEVQQQLAQLQQLSGVPAL